MQNLDHYPVCSEVIMLMKLYMHMAALQDETVSLTDNINVYDKALGVVNKETILEFDPDD